ncbi:MAG: VOC family protein [Limisphaerales bacterium]
MKKANAKKTKSARSRPPIPVRAVDFIMYCTRNPKRTRAFYQKLFGFKRGEEWNDFWSEFKISPVSICLNGPGQTAKWDWQGPAAVALAVDDIHDAARQCRRRRVKILVPPMETRVCWFAIIADPDGNRICLHQRKDGTAG